MIFPFVKIIPRNDILCFEVILSFLVHWCQHFFEYYPNPPIDLLLCVSDIMKAKRLKLFKHLEGIGFDYGKDVWGMLQNVFSGVLNNGN